MAGIRSGGASYSGKTVKGILPQKAGPEQRNIITEYCAS